MAKKRIVTNDVLQRVSRADIELSKWMKEQGMLETDTESCMSLLVEKKIYDMIGITGGIISGKI